MLITGSVGTAADGECFTCDYDLPNNYNYSKPVRLIALLMFAYRMFQIDRDGRYMDVVKEHCTILCWQECLCREQNFSM